MTCRIHRMRFEKDTLVKAGMVGYGCPDGEEDVKRIPSQRSLAGLVVIDELMTG